MEINKYEYRYVCEGLGNMVEHKERSVKVESKFAADKTIQTGVNY